MSGAKTLAGSVAAIKGEERRVAADGRVSLRAAFAALWLTIVALSIATTAARADVSVTATVDRRQVAFGESFTYTITVSGAQGGQPILSAVDGLSFAGPSVQTSISFVNGVQSVSASYVFRVTPTRVGQFTIPANAVDVAGKRYLTQPITITVTAAAAAPDLAQVLFARLRLDSPQVYLGQTAPADLYVFARQDQPVRGFAGMQCDTDALGYQHVANVDQGTQVINGELFNVFRVAGAITPSKPGTFNFGPCAIKVQLSAGRRARHSLFDDPFFDSVFGREELREVPLTIQPTPIEVLPLPDEGRPADFSGAVGPWRMEVTAKPTDVAVGDPITVTIKLEGTGAVVPEPQFVQLDDFKTYEPTSKTTKNELNTQVTREIQQVLVAKHADVKQLPEISFSYFDPATKRYEVVRQAPIPLTVRPAGAAAAVVGAGPPAPPAEKLGEDIVYLKGAPGPAPPARPFCATATFWVVNIFPVVALLSGVLWQRRIDKLRGDVAYARRSRAARNARRLLARATSAEAVQRALQQYLGDRLNLPAAGITGAIADERGLPHTVRELFDACDAARFAGAAVDLPALKSKVEHLIDELEGADR